MVLPGLIYLFINNYLPMFGITIAFKDLNFTKGILGSDWAGFDNFKFLFASRDAGIIIRNTILYNIAFWIVGTVCAILLAVFINELASRRAKRLYQTFVLLPNLMSWVIVSYLAFAFLSSDTGFLNNGLFPLLGVQPVNWYASGQNWPFLLVFINTWKGVGYSMILYFSTLVGINRDYYEAASLDGAGKIQQFFRITLPQLKPVVITTGLLTVGSIFRSDFGLFYQVTRNSGAIYEFTRTIDVYVYQALMEKADYGMSSAASIFQSIVGFVLIVLVNMLIRRYEKNSALF
ncbi:MAG TPA: sugar ABC transporter permease [Clostridiales bacterium]|nr:sugar ABC transporter permease [Clostridiales bacterium]